MVIDKAAYDRIFGEIYYQKYIAKIEFLKQINLFSSWNTKKLSEMSYLLEEKTFKKGTVLYKKGDKSNFFYIVREGEVRVIHNISKNF